MTQAILLDRPGSLAGDAWEAIEAHMNRLGRAVAEGDRSSIVGCCKELVESVARITIEARGRQVASGEEFGPVLAEAHGLLEHQPGPGLEVNAPVRAIANNAKKVAVQLGALRNEYGTGHGRSTVPAIEDEVPALCIDAALIWCRWALRRLEMLIAGSPTQLISDLRTETFTRGILASRLQAANLPSLDEPDQRAVGVAVGQRSASGTFLAADEGVDPAQSPDERTWPAAYKEGVVEGLILNHAGQVDVGDGTYGVRYISGTLKNHSMARAAVEQLGAKLGQAGWSWRFTNNWKAVIAEMKIVAGDLPEDARPAWSAIIEAFEKAGVAYDASTGEDV